MLKHVKPEDTIKRKGCFYYVIRILFALFVTVLAVPFLTPEPEAPLLEDLSAPLQKWFKEGKYIDVHGNNVFVVDWAGPNKNTPTFVLIHGFPTSSFDWRNVARSLNKAGRVVMWDHLGFGFSDKPQTDYVFSIANHVDVMVEVLRQLKCHGETLHLIGHDMGSTVLAEYATRLHRELLPVGLDQLPGSITLTNGGIRVHLANLRITQQLLLIPKIGEWFIKILGRIDPGSFVQRKQLGSVWSPSFGNPQEKEQEIGYMVEMGNYKNGFGLYANLIRYVTDRYHYEPRWIHGLQGLSKKQVPIHVVWGDSDAVAPLPIAHSFQSVVSGVDLRLLEGVGHFSMLEAPEAWAQAVLPWCLRSPKTK